MAESRYAEAYQLFDKGNNNKAVKLFEEASALFLKSENWDLYLTSLINSGKCYRNIEKYDTALAVFSKAEKIGHEKLDTNDLIFSTLYSAQAFLYYALSDCKKSIALAKKSISVRFQKNGMNDSSFVYPYYVLGKNYYIQGKYDLAERNYTIALAYSNLCKNKTSIDAANIWTGLGQVLWAKGDYDKSLNCYNKAQSIYAEFIRNNYEVPEYANNNISIASLYTQLGFYKKSTDILNITETYLKNKYSELHSLRGSVHTYIALNYLKAFDYKRAINECNRSLSFYGNDSITNVYEAYDYYYLGSAYSGVNKMDEAISYFLKYISYKEKNNENNDPYSFLLLANCYEKTKQNQKSDSIYKLIITQLRENDRRSPLLAAILLNYGQFSVNNENTDFAHDCYSEALNICKEVYGFKNINTAIALNQNAKLFAKEKNYNKAIEYFQLAIASQINETDSTDIYANPTIKNITADIDLLISIKGKGKAFHGLYISDSSKTEFLRTSLQLFDLAIHAIDKLKILYSNSESASTLLENENETFDEAIEIASELYQLTDSDKYFNCAFEYAEKSKSSTLLANVRNNEALLAGKVPPAFQEFEKSIQQQLEQYKNLIHEEYKLPKSDKKKIAYLTARHSELNSQNDMMIGYIEKTFPEYYNLKYNAEVISADSIAQKLPANEVFIEYTVTDKNLISFIISNKTKKIYQTPIDSTFSNNVENYVASIKKTKVNDSESCAEFISSSNLMYKVLLAPMNAEFLEGNLIIIPDEILYNIPFESLLYKEVKNDAKGYKNLPYLVKRNAVSYAASGTLLYENNPISKDIKNTLLAFAPTYEYDNSETSIENSETRKYIKSLKPLKGALDEVNTINSIIDGDVFIGSKATVQNFKANASKFGILHLAMHAKIDDENPMYSKLAFEQGENDNGLLSTYELYNMQVNSQLSVLSACNTGAGKLVKGEGMLCLARGFMYAGCPSLVMTLWEINDKSGSELMKSFYGYLAEGKTKDESLRLAKLDFLNNSDKLKSSPYYWAGYINFGNNEALKIETKTSSTTFAFNAGLSVLLFGFFLILFAKSNAKKKLLHFLKARPA